MCVFLGANGSGKSSLFDVFTFLQDSLKNNVRQALAKRGGYNQVVSRNQTGPIVIEIKFRETVKSPLITYEVQINQRDGQVLVEKELLQYRRGQTGRPWRFLDFKNGEGQAITNEDEYETPGVAEKRDFQKLDSPDILAIKGLGQFQKFKAIAAFRKLIENWYISDFHISDARESQEASYAEQLSTRGENLPLVAQYLFENHPNAFNRVLEKMKRAIPGVERVEAEVTTDGRVVLKFKDGAFKDPFIGRHVSDGTIKMFAYLLLLNDPNPHPLLAIEEPENQLHPELLEELAEEFRGYAKKGEQVFISTHSPDFVNGVELHELFWLTKEKGYTQIFRAGDVENLKALIAEGDLPGALWKQGLFTGSGPA